MLEGNKGFITKQVDSLLCKNQAPIVKPLMTS